MELPCPLQCTPPFQHLNVSNPEVRSTLFLTLFKLSVFPYPIPTEYKFYVLVAQSCPIPSDSMNYSSPGSSVGGILQARTLEWVAIPFSRGSSNPGTELKSLALQADSLPSELAGKPKL